MAGSNDPQILALLITEIILASVFLSWVGALAPGTIIADPTPSLPLDKSTINVNLSLKDINVTNGTAWGLETTMNFQPKGTWIDVPRGWQNTGFDDELLLTNAKVNGYGQYDNTYLLSNPNGANFDVYISIPTGLSGIVPLTKAVLLRVRGVTLSVPTGPFTAKEATAQYDPNQFSIRTTFNETNMDTHIYVDGNEVLSGNDLSIGYWYVGERVFGGLHVYAPGLIVESISTTDKTVSTNWYGDPVTGFLIGAWNFFKTMIAFLFWDVSFPPEWNLAMNTIYMIFVRVPCYIALFIGIRLLRGTG